MKKAAPRATAGKSTSAPATGASSASAHQPAPLVIPLSANAAEAKQQLQQAANALRSSPHQQVVLDCQGRPLGTHGGLAQLITSLQRGWGQLVVRKTCLDITRPPRLHGRLRFEHTRLRAAPYELLIVLKDGAELELHYCVVELVPMAGIPSAMARVNFTLCKEYGGTGLIAVKAGASLKASRTVWRGLAQCLGVFGGSAVLEECWLQCTDIWCAHLWSIQVQEQGGKLLLRGCLLEAGWEAGIPPAIFGMAGGQIVVEASDHGVAVMDRCTLLWHGLPPAPAAPSQPSASRHPGSATTVVALVKSESRGRVQLSRCELRAVEGRSHDRFLVMGIHAGQDGAVTASRCSMAGCFVHAKERSSVVGSQLRLTAGTSGWGPVCVPNLTANCGLVMEAGSSCMLARCTVERFRNGLQVTGGQELPASADLRRCRIRCSGAAMLARGNAKVVLWGCQLETDKEGTLDGEVHGCVAAIGDANVVVVGGVLKAVGDHATAGLAHGDRAGLHARGSILLAGPGSLVGALALQRGTVHLRDCSILKLHSYPGEAPSGSSASGSSASGSSGSGRSGSTRGSSGSGSGGLGSQLPHLMKKRAGEPYDPCDRRYQDTGAFSMQGSLSLEDCEVAGFHLGVGLAMLSLVEAERSSFACKVGLEVFQQEAPIILPGNAQVFSLRLTGCHMPGVSGYMPGRAWPEVLSSLVDGPASSAMQALRRPSVAHLLQGAAPAAVEAPAAAEAASASVAAAQGPGQAQGFCAGAGGSSSQGSGNSATEQDQQQQAGPSSERPSAPECTHCHKQLGKLRLCVGCLATHYCSSTCAKKDWVAHRQQCALLGVGRALSLGRG